MKPVRLIESWQFKTAMAFVNALSAMMFLSIVDNNKDHWSIALTMGVITGALAGIYAGAALRKYWKEVQP